MLASLPIEPDPYITVGVIFGLVAFAAVCGRMYVRIRMINAFGKDDVACLITLLFSAMFAFSLLAIWRITDLRPYADIPKPNLIPAAELVFIILLSYCAASLVLKVSVALLLLRILVSKRMKHVVYGVTSIACMFGAALFFMILFECGSPANFPTYVLHGGRCLPNLVILSVTYTHAAITAIADITFAVLPIFMISGSQMDKRMKLYVGGILSLASIGCICTLARFAWVPELQSRTVDFLGQTRAIALMSALELDFGMICMSLSAYGPIFRKIYVPARRTKCRDPEQGLVKLRSMKVDIDVQLTVSVCKDDGNRAASDSATGAGLASIAEAKCYFPGSVVEVDEESEDDPPSWPQTPALDDVAAKPSFMDRCSSVIARPAAVTVSMTRHAAPSLIELPLR